MSTIDTRKQQVRAELNHPGFEFSRWNDYDDKIRFRLPLPSGGYREWSIEVEIGDDDFRGKLAAIRAEAARAGIALPMPAAPALQPKL